MSYSIDHETKIAVLSCYKCGLIFGMPEELRDTLLKNGETFYCPNGHPQHFAESLAEKLKRKDKALKAERRYSNNLYEEKEEFRRRMIGQKIQKTKTLNRIKNGVCPHCNKHFENLHEHMKTEHFKDEST